MYHRKNEHESIECVEGTKNHFKIKENPVFTTKIYAFYVTKKYIDDPDSRHSVLG